MNVRDCPGEPLLRDYLAGRLDRERHEAIDDHLDACAGCQSTADGLERLVDASFPGLSPAPFDESPVDPALASLVGRAKALGLAGPSPDERPALGEGTALGNYVLLGPVGGGGMGRVFKARHRLMNRFVAVKVLSPELLRSAGARARFRREAEAAARLDHPHIVAAYDAGEADGRDFLVMEYVEGQNLADLVKMDGPLSVERALDYVAQAARGLAHAHAAGVVHRDVKPANLLVDAHGTVKVLDMGLARVPTDDGRGDVGLTSAGVVMGTAAYMAPEQAADTRRADERSDVYSLGCCLHYLLTGRPPYKGGTPLETVFAHREQSVPSLRRARPDCPTAVDALFRAMLSKRPEDRPASMTALLLQVDSLNDKPRRGRRKWPWLVAAATAAAIALLAWLRPWPAAGPAVPDVPRAVDVPVAVVAPSAPAPVQPPPVNLVPVVPPFPAPPVAPRKLSVDTVRVAAGEFWRGSADSDPDAQPDEKPRKRIAITRTFFLAKTKVTQALYREVMGKNPSIFSPAGPAAARLHGADTSNHPVDSVRWIDAVGFCNRLSGRDGLPPYYRVEGAVVTVNGGDGWRLPTEAEWEYACRAGTDARWSFGDDRSALGDYAWFAENSGGVTHPVGLKKPNAWGLYDMHGDLPEWCWDRYGPDYYKTSPLSDPPGAPVGESRVYRGGAWNDEAAQTRSASRLSLGVAYGAVLTHVGLRVARDAAP